jgi:hypothetical protein
MAETLTYSTLFADLQNYSGKGKSSTNETVIYNQIPRIINHAERCIVTDLKLQGYEKTFIAAMETDVSVYAKPDRWKETISMQIVHPTTNRRYPLFPRSYEYIRRVCPNEATTGLPLFYADHGATHWLVGPTPDLDYGFELKVYQMPAALSDDNGTNWLTDEAPQLLLACALREFAKFIGWARATEFDADYKMHLAAFGREDMKKIMDRAAEREGA